MNNSFGSSPRVSPPVAPPDVSMMTLEGIKITALDEKTLVIRSLGEKAEKIRREYEEKLDLAEYARRFAKLKPLYMAVATCDHNLAAIESVARTAWIQPLLTTETHFKAVLAEKEREAIGLFRNGDYEAAEKLFEVLALAAASEKPSPYYFAPRRWLVSIHCERGNVDKAYGLLNELIGTGLQQFFLDETGDDAWLPGIRRKIYALAKHEFDKNEQELSRLKRKVESCFARFNEILSQQQADVSVVRELTQVEEDCAQLAESVTRHTGRCKVLVGFAEFARNQDDRSQHPLTNSLAQEVQRIFDQCKAESAFATELLRKVAEAATVDDKIRVLGSWVNSNIALFTEETMPSLASYTLRFLVRLYFNPETSSQVAQATITLLTQNSAALLPHLRQLEANIAEEFRKNEAALQQISQNLQGCRTSMNKLFTTDIKAIPQSYEGHQTSLASIGQTVDQQFTLLQECGKLQQKLAAIHTLFETDHRSSHAAVCEEHARCRRFCDVGQDLLQMLPVAQAKAEEAAEGVDVPAEEVIVQLAALAPLSTPIEATNSALITWIEKNIEAYKEDQNCFPVHGWALSLLVRIYLSDELSEALGAQASSLLQKHSETLLRHLEALHGLLEGLFTSNEEALRKTEQEVQQQHLKIAAIFSQESLDGKSFSYEGYLRQLDPVKQLLEGMLAKMQCCGILYRKLNAINAVYGPSVASCFGAVEKTYGECSALVQSANALLLEILADDAADALDALVLKKASKTASPDQVVTLLCRWIETNLYAYKNAATCPPLHLWSLGLLVKLYLSVDVSQETAVQTGSFLDTNAELFAPYLKLLKGRFDGRLRANEEEFQQIGIAVSEAANRLKAVFDTSELQLTEDFTRRGDEVTAIAPTFELHRSRLTTCQETHAKLLLLNRLLGLNGMNSRCTKVSKDFDKYGTLCTRASSLLSSLTGKKPAEEKVWALHAWVRDNLDIYQALALLASIKEIKQPKQRIETLQAWLKEHPDAPRGLFLPAVDDMMKEDERTQLLDAWLQEDLEPYRTDPESLSRVHTFALHLLGRYYSSGDLPDDVLESSIELLRSNVPTLFPHLGAFPHDVSLSFGEYSLQMSLIVLATISCELQKIAGTHAGIQELKSQSAGSFFGRLWGGAASKEPQKPKIDLNELIRRRIHHVPNCALMLHDILIAFQSYNFAKLATHSAEQIMLIFEIARKLLIMPSPIVAEALNRLRTAEFEDQLTALLLYRLLRVTGLPFLYDDFEQKLPKSHRKDFLEFISICKPTDQSIDLRNHHKLFFAVLATARALFESDVHFSDRRDIRATFRFLLEQYQLLRTYIAKEERNGRLQEDPTALASLQRVKLALDTAIMQFGVQCVARNKDAPDASIASFVLEPVVESEDASTTEDEEEVVDEREEPEASPRREEAALFFPTHLPMNALESVSNPEVAEIGSWLNATIYPNIETITVEKPLLLDCLLPLPACAKVTKLVAPLARENSSVVLSCLKERFPGLRALELHDGEAHLKCINTLPLATLKLRNIDGKLNLSECGVLKTSMKELTLDEVEMVPDSLNWLETNTSLQKCTLLAKPGTKIGRLATKKQLIGAQALLSLHIRVDSLDEDIGLKESIPFLVGAHRQLSALTIHAAYSGSILELLRTSTRAHFIKTLEITLNPEEKLELLSECTALEKVIFQIKDNADKERVQAALKPLRIRGLKEVYVRKPNGKLSSNLLD